MNRIFALIVSCGFFTQVRPPVIQRKKISSPRAEKPPSSSLNQRADKMPRHSPPFMKQKTPLLIFGAYFTKPVFEESVAYSPNLIVRRSLSPHMRSDLNPPPPAQTAPYSARFFLSIAPRTVSPCAQGTPRLPACDAATGIVQSPCVAAASSVAPTFMN